MDIFDFAVKMETDAESYYRKLAEQTDIEGIRNIFLDLAADEKKHVEIFQSMKARPDSAAMRDSGALSKAKNTFEKLMQEKPVVSHLQGNLDAYRHAMKIEAEAARVYQEALTHESSPEVKKLLQRVIEEEQKHYNIIENLYDFVNAPNEYLAWGEFSNLEEFRNFGRDTDV
ncbi:ferritin-like domain-containing protein [Pelovirga terrestris]|uniref:Ferritin family protein n=1 Tax=Pelovirga terrestris TaxID=2771352 RepID=A0A8J6QQH1_9BACT|nr:ferritin family protein [Pelovirga terrestris]MBD1399910.1 ferritin family protein [Pelovirga terrestris]